MQCACTCVLTLPRLVVPTCISLSSVQAYTRRQHFKRTLTLVMNKDFLRCRLTDELDVLERCYLQVDGRHAACEHPHQNLIVPWLRQVGRLCCKCIAFEHNASSHYLKLILVPALRKATGSGSNFTKRRNERERSLQINKQTAVYRHLYPIYTFQLEYTGLFNNSNPTHSLVAPSRRNLTTDLIVFHAFIQAAVDWLYHG